VNALYRARNNKDLNDNTGREITAVIVLADAINRAGSTDPEKLRLALVATDIPGDQTIMPWKGIRFDATGQNVAATPVIQQVRGGAYHTIYPFDVAAEEAVWNVGK
jgi:branched-chain amino acid transport system substrate-binding protein